MKPTSIIFLIVAASLILVGSVMCVIASYQAEVTGVSLYEDRNSDGDTVVEESVSVANISKLELRIEKGDIRIVVGGERSYIEMINFSKNSYRCTSSGNTMTLYDSVDFSDPSTLISMITEGFEFKGIRQYVRFGSEDDRAKQLTLHLTEADAASLKVFEMVLGTGNISVENYPVAVDYNVRIGNGNFTMNGTDAVSKLSASVSVGNINIKGAFAEGSVDLTAGQGDITLDLVQLGYRTLNLIAPNGMVWSNGVEQGSSMTSNPLNSTAKVTATADRGSIRLTTSGVYSPLGTDTADTAQTAPSDTDAVS